MSRMRGIQRTTIAFALLFALAGPVVAADRDPRLAGESWSRLWIDLLKRLAGARAGGETASRSTPWSERTSPCVDPYGQPCQTTTLPPASGSRP